MAVLAAGAGPDAPTGAFDALLTPESDVVALASDVLDRIAEADENGHT
jgi:hypothetical protein